MSEAAQPKVERLTPAAEAALRAQGARTVRALEAKAAPLGELEVARRRWRGIIIGVGLGLGAAVASAVGGFVLGRRRRRFHAARAR